jgi:hypothetical protein
MAELFIDRLTLQVPGFSESEAQRLAWAIADGLAAADWRDGIGDVSELRVDLTASADAKPNKLADQIVSEILRQLQRVP